MNCLICAAKVEFENFDLIIMQVWSSKCCTSHGKFLVALLIFVKKMEVPCDYVAVLSAASNVL